MIPKANNARIKFSFLIILTLIFLLNDFVFIYADASKYYIRCLLIDYSTRISVIFIILYLIKQKIFTFSDLGFTRMQIEPLIIWTVILSATGVFISQVWGRYFAELIPHVCLVYYPRIENSFIEVFDLTIGILLVSVTEEAVFRGYYFVVLKKYIKNPVMIIVISSFVFGLIHWSRGVDSIITNTLWGILPIISFWKTKSILPAIIAHYVTDLLIFS